MAVKNAADEAQVKAASEKEKFGREQELDDMKKILNTDFGRRFIWRVMSACGVFTTSFTGNSETFFREGKRSVGLMILADVTAAKPEAYMQMSNEANLKEK